MEHFLPSAEQTAATTDTLNRRVWSWWFCDKLPRPERYPEDNLDAAICRERRKGDTPEHGCRDCGFGRLFEGMIWISATDLIARFAKRKVLVVSPSPRSSLTHRFDILGLKHQLWV